MTKSQKDELALFCDAVLYVTSLDPGLLRFLRKVLLILTLWDEHRHFSHPNVFAIKIKINM